MPIKLADLKFYGSAVMPDDDTPTAIGGAIDQTKRLEFFDVSGLVQLISDSTYDTTQIVTVYGRDTGGALVNEAKTVNGITPVVYSTNFERLLKAIKNAVCVGNLAVETQTAERTNTAQAGSVDDITLDAAASAVDDFFTPMVTRLTAATGSPAIRQTIKYVGASKLNTVDHVFAVAPTAGTTFRMAKGIVFEKDPVEVFEIRRPFYNAAANPPAGATKEYYDKGFWRNTHASLSLTTAVVKEASDPSGLITFGVEATLDAAGTNGAGNNRLVAPGAITFDNADKNVVGGGILSAGSGQGVWLKVTLLGGEAAQNTKYVSRLQGQTI